MKKTGNWVEDTLNEMRLIFWITVGMLCLIPVLVGVIMYLIIAN